MRKRHGMGKRAMMGGVADRRAIACVIGVLLSSCSEATGSDIANGRDYRPVKSACQARCLRDMWLDIGGSFQIRCWSGAYSSRHTRGNGRPESPRVPEESALGAMTVRACKPLRMQVTLQPDEADAVIQQFGNREINHIGMIPRSARWLHMSQSSKFGCVL